VDVGGRNRLREHRSRRGAGLVTRVGPTIGLVRSQGARLGIPDLNQRSNP
jgi:hypothetical protein